MFASSDPSDRIAAGKELVKVAAGDSTGCKPIAADTSKIAVGSLGWDWLPWMSAAERCKSPHQQGLVELYQVTADGAGTYEEQLRDQQVGDTKPTKQSSDCGAFHHVTDSKGRNIGHVECFYVGGELWTGWYFDKGPRAGTVGAMPGHNFTSFTKFTDFLGKSGIL